MLRIRAEDGREYALRLCNPVVTDRGLVEQEIAFVQHVAKLGSVHVPALIPNRGGEYVTVAHGDEDVVIACLFEWIHGGDLRGRVTPEAAHQMGRAMAHLHEAAHSYAFPVDGDGLREGYRWDERLVLNHLEWIGEHEAQIRAERSLALRRAVNRVAAQMAAMPKTRETYGLIHADLHPGNLIACAGDIAVIDFDQLGRGHFAYDLANLYTELTPEPAGKDALWQSVKEGYRTVSPLPVESDAELEPFICAGELGFLDWYYNSPNPDVRARLGGRLEHALAVVLRITPDP